MNTKMKKTIGWVLAILLVGFFLFSASGKFMMMDAEMEKMMNGNFMAYGSKTRMFIGLLEVGCALLFLIPRTSGIGAILLSSYMGGAIATHLTHGDSNIVFQVIFTVLVWLTALIRTPELFNRFFGKIK